MNLQPGLPPTALNDPPAHGRNMGADGMIRQGQEPDIGFVEPCLPSAAKVPPSGSDWIHEIKHDGFRFLTWRAAGGVPL